MSDSLRAWLRRLPKPVKVRLDGVKVIDVPTGRGCWVELIATLSALKPKQLECLGVEGQTLRARDVDPEELGDDEPEEDPETQTVIEELTENGRLIACIEKLCETMRSMANEASSRANKAEDALSLAVVARAKAEAMAYVAQNAQPQAEERSELEEMFARWTGGAKAGAAVASQSNGVQQEKTNGEG
jgi:hypothetical protein